MKTRYLKTPVILVAVAISIACADFYYSDSNEFDGYFDPASTNADSNQKPYFYAANSTFYDEYSDLFSTNETNEIPPDRKVTLQAWQEWLGPGFNQTEIENGLYGDSLEPSFFHHLKKSSPKTAQYYSMLRSNQQFLNINLPYWEEPAPIEVEECLERYQNAVSQFQSQKVDFLKERYAYLAIQQAMRAGLIEPAMQLIEEMQKKVVRKSYLQDWARCWLATCYAASNEKNRAVFEYAQVFSHCPSKRKEAFMSFRLLGLKFDPAVLQFAKTNREKAAVYELCGVQPYAKSLEMAKQLAALEPGNSWIKVIVSREINRNEVYYRANPSEYFYFGQREDSIRIANGIKDATNYFKEIRDFTQRMAHHPNAGSKAWWLTATAYLDYINGDFDASENALLEAKKAGFISSKLNQQIATQELLNIAATEPWISPAIEKRILTLVETIQKDSVFYHINARNRALVRLAHLYQNPGRKEHKYWWKWSCTKEERNQIDPETTPKAFLLLSLTTHQSMFDWGGNYLSETSLWNLIDTTTAADMQKVVDFIRQPAPSENNKKLIRICRLDSSKVKLWTARRYMSESQFQKAAGLFEGIENDQLKGEYDTYSMFSENPFNIRMPGEKNVENPFTARSFARYMATLEEKSKIAVGDSAADLYYQLGCGAYNLTWYGNSWILTKASWSINQIEYYWLDEQSKVNKAKALDRFFSNNYLTTSKALEYFEKSANAARNPEFKARASYMAARCEFNAAFAKETRNRVLLSWEEKEKLPEKAKQVMKATADFEWMNRFRTTNQGTRFHDKMMKECSLYADFFTNGGVDE